MYSAVFFGGFKLVKKLNLTYKAIDMHSVRLWLITNMHYKFWPVNGHFEVSTRTVSYKICILFTQLLYWHLSVKLCFIIDLCCDFKQVIYTPKHVVAIHISHQIYLMLFLIIKPNICTNFSNLFLQWNSTCFGQFLCPSSGVFLCTHSSSICHTGLLTACEQDQDIS
jgi:hypothetical protein